MDTQNDGLEKVTLNMVIFGIYLRFQFVFEVNYSNYKTLLYRGFFQVNYYHDFLLERPLNILN